MRRGFGRHEAWWRGFGWRMPFPPPWAGPHGHGHGHGGRGRRRNVRTAVLRLLAERPMHGYEIITELENRTGGVWRPSPGSVYPTLQMLEDEGLIVRETGSEASGQPDQERAERGSESSAGGRRRFMLTDAGRAEAERLGDEAPWDAMGGAAEDWVDLRDAAFGAMNALRQVMMTGTEEQRRQAIEVIAETRRKLYAILAD